MAKQFGYPEFNTEGEKVLTRYEGEYSAMRMDIRVYRLCAGQKRRWCKAEEETAVLLLCGNVQFSAGNTVQQASRADVFSEGPWCVHVCAGTEVCVTAQTEAQVLVQSTRNDALWKPRFYRPEDAPWHYSCEGKYGNTANRRVNTIFDHEIEPLSNMVLGEVLNDRGNWSGYLPHRHPQPEVYYFLFDRPEGFGASFVGDDVYKSVSGSFSAIPGGCLHPQSAAPGFQMYTCWMIRHLEGNPWNQTDRCEDERYLWLHDSSF